MLKLKNLIILVLLNTNIFYGQSNQKLIDTGSVKNQFDYLINESASYYQEQKVVKNQWLLKLKKNVVDTLSKNKNTISIHRNNLSIQEKEIDSLINQLSEIELLNEKLNIEEQQITFLGIPMNKSGFKSLTYALILIFLCLFSFYFWKFKQSNTITKEAKLALKEVEEEFEEHRSKALEREQKVMRKLQDELNKQKKD